MSRLTRALEVGALAAGIAVTAWLWSSGAQAQDLEPRAYSAVPVGTHFALFTYARSAGDIAFDPSVPVTDGRAKIDTYALGYSRSFGLAGQTASLAVIAPYIRGDVSGIVQDTPAQAHRAAIGDLRLRFSANLLGNPALTPAEFARRAPTTTAGASLLVIAPTGQYDSSHLVNVGSNRWTFKPELGVSHPMGDWFIEGIAGVWLYTDNPDFYGGQRRSQDPLWTLQAHGGYNFRPGLWLAVDATHYTGGQTSLNGAQQQDYQRATRYGVTLSVPLDPDWSLKLAWSNALTTRIGGKFNTVAATMQYRWFDP